MENHIDSEVAEEWEGSASGPGKQLDVRPMVVNEMKFLELLSTGANQCQDVGTVQASRGDVKWGSFCAFEPGFREEVGPPDAQV